jgi:hypothetical protein
MEFVKLEEALRRSGYTTNPKGSKVFKTKIKEWDMWDGRTGLGGKKSKRLEKALKDSDELIGNFAYSTKPIANKLYKEDATVDAKIKDLELQKLKLFGKALRAFPSSPKQKEIHKEIEAIFAEINRLKNKNNEMEGDI